MEMWYKYVVCDNINIIGGRASVTGIKESWLIAWFASGASVSILYSLHIYITKQRQDWMYEMLPLKGGSLVSIFV